MGRDWDPDKAPLWPKEKPAAKTWCGRPSMYRWGLSPDEKLESTCTYCGFPIVWSQETRTNRDSKATVMVGRCTLSSSSP